jgi:hypothetical protein
MKASRLSCVTTVLAALALAPPAFGQQAEPVEPIEGLPEHLIYLYTGMREEAAPADAQNQVYAGGRRWEPGRTLRVCLFGGNAVVGSLIRQAASEWNDYSSIKLDFGPAGSWNNCLSPQGGYYQIRIGFAEKGYWSVVGNDSEGRLDPHAPSMNLEGFNRRYSPDRGMQPDTVLAQAVPYHVATIKHEFGHALGLLHEHQNTAMHCHDEIRWDGPGNVYEYLGGPTNNWTEDQVNRNMGFIDQTDPDYVPGAPDRTSIMMYSLPEKIFVHGHDSPCYVPVNLAISDKDKQIVAQLYPPIGAGAPAPSDIALDSATVRPIASTASAMELQDNTDRIVADLESEDVYTRRNARARLAGMMSQLPEAEVTELIRKSTTGTYRQQLGVAVAVANAPEEFELSTASKAALEARIRTARDATLRQQLKLAVDRE